MKTSNLWKPIIILFFALPLRGFATRPAQLRSNDVIIYHGKLIRPTGESVDGSLSISISIFSPEPSKCLLWSENQTITAFDGAFNIEIGHSQNRVSSGPGSASDGASSFRDVFLNSSTLSIPSSLCESGTSYVPTSSDDRLMNVDFVDNGKSVNVAEIPIKAVPFAKQAIEIGGFGVNNLMKISGTGSTIQFTPTEVQNLKGLLGGTINWDLGNERIVNVSDPIANTDATNKQWVVDYVANNGGGGGGGGGGGTVSFATVTAALGYTPVDPSNTLFTNSLQNGGNSGAVVVGTNSANDLSFEVNNGTQMTLSSSGSLGIGTASPSAKLEVTGQIKVTGGSPAAGRFLQSDAAGLGSWVALSAANVNTSLGYTPVNRAGDTMTGVLNLPSNGLVVGTNQLVVSSGSLGIGTTTPSEKLEVIGKIKAPEFCIGVDCRTAWPGVGGGGTVTQVFTGGAPLSVTNGTSTPTVSITAANSTTPGYLSAADWVTFNGKQSTALANGQVFVGNGSNVAAGRLFRISDVRSTSGAGTDPFLAAAGACSAGQVLTYVSVNDKLECQTFLLSATQVASSVSYTVTDNTANPFEVSPTFNYASSGSYINKGINSNVLVQGSGNNNSAVGVYGSASWIGNQNTGTVDKIYSGVFELSNDSSGTVGAGTGVYAGVYNNNVSATMQNAYGIRASFSNAGTVDNTYGLYIDDIVSGTQTNAPFAIYTNGTAKSYFGGNVGVGDLNPATRLNVQAPSVSSIAMSVTNPSGSAKFSAGLTSDAGQILLRNSGGGVTVDLQGGGNSYLTGGNLGIGTTTPSAKMEVQGTTTAAGSDFTGALSKITVSPSSGQTVGGWGSSPVSKAFSAGAEIPTGNSNSVNRIYGLQGSAGHFGTGAVGYMVGTEGTAYNINGSAADGIWGGHMAAESESGAVVNMVGANVFAGAFGGTVTNQVGLQVELDTDGGTVTNRYGLLLKNPNGAATNDYGIYQEGTQKNYFAGNVGIGTSSPGYTLHVVGTAGLSSGTAWTNASDARLKDIQGDYEYGLDEVLKLHTVRYNYKKDNALGLPSDFDKTGFIAQEVQKVIPDAVTERRDGYLELNVDPIHWAVVNAIKDFYKRWIESDTDLRERLAAKDREIQSVRQENTEIKAYLCAKDAEAPFCREP